MRNKITSSTVDENKIGENMLVYKDMPPEWTGPFTVLDVAGKTLMVDIIGKDVQFSIGQVRKYHQNVIMNASAPEDKEKVEPGIGESLAREIDAVRVVNSLNATDDVIDDLHAVASGQEG